MNERGHWTSASNAEPDKLCGGRHLACVNLPEPPASPEADSGRIVHALWTGMEPDRDPTPGEIDKAAELTSRELEVADVAGFPPVRMRVTETRLWHEFGAYKHSGRFDVALYDSASGRALVLDGKSGWLEVPPPNTNQQLRDLAVLLWLTLSPQEISVNILKPFGRQDASCVYTAEDLRRSLREMEERVRRSNDPKSARVAGEVQCRYCRAALAGKCPEHSTWLSACLPAVSPPLPMTTAAEWTPEQRAIFCERWKAAEKWGGERWVEIKNLLLKDPEAVPGFGLKEGNMIETITKPAEVFNRFCSLGGGKDGFMRAVKIGKGKLKDEVRAVTELRGKALDSQLDALLKGCTVSTKAAPTIERTK